MKALCSGVLLIGSVFFWWIWQPLIPDSGFFYLIHDMNQVKRVQGVFQSSPVDVPGIDTVWGGVIRFVGWCAITSSNAIEGEPTGICFFNHDGDFSGFLNMSGEKASQVNSIRIYDKTFIVTMDSGEQKEELSFSIEEAELSWPKTFFRIRLE